MPTPIPTKNLEKHCNPYGDSPWGVFLSKDDVTKALSENRLANEHGTADHAGRIAFLIKNPCFEPIVIDVGVPSMGCCPPWFIDDGNHRLAAALYIGQDVIQAEVSGDVNFAKHLFGVDCRDFD